MPHTLFCANALAIPPGLAITVGQAASTCKKESGQDTTGTINLITEYR